MASAPTIRPLIHNELAKIDPTVSQDVAASAIPANPQAMPLPQADPALRPDVLRRHDDLQGGHPKPPLSAEASLAVIDDLMTQLDSNADGLISQQEFAAGATHGPKPQGPGNPPGALGGPGHGNPPGALGGPGRGNPRGPVGGPGGHANPAGMVGGPGQGNPPGKMGGPGRGNPPGALGGPGHGNPPGALGGPGRGNQAGPAGAQGNPKSPEELFARFDLDQDGALNADEFAAMQTMKFIKDSFPDMAAFKGFLEQHGITPDVHVDKAQSDALREARLAMLAGDAVADVVELIE